MGTVLVAAIVAVGAVFTLLTVGIAFGRVLCGLREWWYRRRRAVLEPVITRDLAVCGRSPRETLRPAMRPGDRPLVLRILLEQVQRVRGLARERLGAALDELGYVSRWIAALRSARWWKRADAAEKLGLAYARRALEPLVQILEDPVPEVRLRAARALTALGGRAASRPLVEALARPDRWSAIRVADLLSGAGRAAVEELVEAWDSLSRPARLAALDILGQVRDLSVGPFLVRCLNESVDSDERARAAHALGVLADPAARDALVAALGDATWPVRAMAAKALGRLGSRDAVDELVGALSDRAWWVRANAAEALRSLGREGLRALTGVLDSSDRFARQHAVMMLQDAGVIDSMAEALASGEAAERDRALRFLQRLREEGHRSLIQGLACNHPRARRDVEMLLAPFGVPGAGS
jgi:HEAT repeat protein